MNGKKIGILGGGQLGKMLLQEAQTWDLDISILDPDPKASCATMTSNFVVGNFDDYETVYQFGKKQDLITIEIENVNTNALKQLELEGVEVYPQPHIVEIIKNKRTQKIFYQEHSIPTAAFVLIDNKEEIYQHIDFLPAVQKIGIGGYDGKGVQSINTIEEIEKGFTESSLLEKKIDIQKELSVIVSRNRKGEIKCFPIVEMVFHPKHNLVDFLLCPAHIPKDIHDKALEISIKVIEAFQLVGTLAVEMFWTKDGDILVNEVAPRPHNSGHHTLKATLVSQFEQHWRAILNLPLSETTILQQSVLLNLLGSPDKEGDVYYEGMQSVLALEGVYLYLYGKKKTKPFRKMGHCTILGDDLEVIKEKVDFVKKHFIITSH
jgi:5-(carboxyamino)imidazole ribonucleotide synthase